MENFSADIFRWISPLANADFVGVIYLISCMMILFLTGMPIIIRFSLAFPLAITGLIFLLVPTTMPIPYEQVVLVRLSHLVFMLSMIINCTLYAIAKRKRVL